MKNQITALIIGVSVLLMGLIVAQAYKYRFISAEGVSVVGMAQVDFTSDLIVWEGSYSRKSKDLKAAYDNLKKDEQQIRSYLRQKGVADSSVIISSVNLQKEFNPVYGDRGILISNEFTGFNLTQQVRIESMDINRVEKLSREVTELIQQGIELTSPAPRYYYTKMTGLKMDLLAKASADALQRAETIAKSVHSNLGKLKKANMGVFQITGRNSSEEYSYGGSYNTSDRNKTASITMRMEYILR